MNSAGIALVLALAACPRATLAQTAPVKEALRHGLSWHYRWIERLPSGVAAIRCTIAYFEERSLAFCTPGPLEIDIETGEGGSPRVTNIVHVHGTFKEILGQFRNNLRPGSEISPKEMISIATDDLVRCKVDLDRTRRAPGALMNEHQRKGLHADGLKLRYPLVCEGDPFYLLYLMKEDRISSIWKFIVGPEGLDLTWSFDLDNKQRQIPERAIENLSKEMWYRVEK